MNTWTLREGLPELLNCPLSRRMRGDVEMENSPRRDLHRNKDVQDPEGRRHRDEEITGDDGLRMILNKRTPALIGDAPRPVHVEVLCKLSEGTVEYPTSTLVHRQFAPRPKSGSPDSLFESVS